MKTCAIIPAAGTGSRLGSPLPKILTPISENETIWSILRKKLLTAVDHINLIVAPSFLSLFQSILKNDLKNNLVSLSMQSQPTGMGDAIFCGYSVWSKANTILVIWGDQIFVSTETIFRALTTHNNAEQTVTLPLTQMQNPYVEYILEDNHHLLAVKESREGDICNPEGLSDVGCFVLSTKNILVEWKLYQEQINKGARTGEINFLPFLPYLSTRGWKVNHLLVPDKREARGVNTQEDLSFFKNLLSSTSISI